MYWIFVILLAGKILEPTPISPPEILVAMLSGNDRYTWAASTTHDTIHAILAHYAVLVTFVFITRIDTCFQHQ